MKTMAGRKTKPPLASRIKQTEIENEQSEWDIDDQFRDIIEKQCPGKLYSVLRRKVKKRITTEPRLNQKPEHPRDIRVFERTFYNQRKKSSERTQRTQTTKELLRLRLGMNKKEPTSFFQINRPNILSLERSSGSLKAPRNFSFSEKKMKRKNIHPYMKISENMSKIVCKRRNQFRYSHTDFSPFDNIEPIYIE